MTPEQRITVLENIIAHLILPDRVLFQKHLQLFDGRNIQVGRTTGTKIGTNAAQKLGFFGNAPIAQWASATDRGDLTSNTGSALNTDVKFNGNTGGGTTYYSIGDIVAGLKALGLFAN